MTSEQLPAPRVRERGPRSFRYWSDPNFPVVRVFLAVPHNAVMQLVYIDETGAARTAGSKSQPCLILAAVMVDEDKVRLLGAAMNTIATDHLGWLPHDFEFHGYEIWHGRGYWKDKSYDELLAVFEAVISLLDTLGLSVAYSRINKANLHSKYNGAADGNAYRLALQFLLEKIDGLCGPNRIVIADESKQEILMAKKMVKAMQEDGWGEVPGAKLATIIDALHFVQSHDSPGVQMADMVAYVLQRATQGSGNHPNAVTSLARMSALVSDHTTTYRMEWPP